MVRFIFLCMALVGISLTVLPAMKIYDGISSERDAVMAEAETPLPLKDSSKEQLAAGADAATGLNDIETAAGGFEGSMGKEGAGLASGFRNTAPTALEEPVEPSQFPEKTFE